MSEQHIYRGTGSPRDLGLFAPVGSHYIDESRSDLVWIAIYAEPNEDGGYTEWIKLEEYYPTIAAIGSYGHPFAAGVKISVLMPGTTPFSISEVTPGRAVYSNVQFEAGGDEILQYASESPFLVQVEPISAESISVIVTPLTAQTA